MREIVDQVDKQTSMNHRARVSGQLRSLTVESMGMKLKLHQVHFCLSLTKEGTSGKLK